MIKKTVRKKASKPKKIAGILKEEFRRNPTRFIMYIIILMTVAGIAIGGISIKTKYFEIERPPIKAETIKALRQIRK